MNKVTRYFKMAKLAAARSDGGYRRFRLGAVGIRTDGAVVTSRNLSTRTPDMYAHAERRLARKLDYGAEVYVVRILRNGKLASARPCPDCAKALRQKGVRCYYSINDNEYGVMG